MLTKFRTKFSKELFEKLHIDMGYMDFTGYKGGAEPPEYIDVGYAFFTLIVDSGPQKFLGIFKSNADASREISNDAMLERAKKLAELYNEAAEENSIWLYTKEDTWEDPMET